MLYLILKIFKRTPNFIKLFRQTYSKVAEMEKSFCLRCFRAVRFVPAHSNLRTDILIGDNSFFNNRMPFHSKLVHTTESRQPNK